MNKIGSDNGIKDAVKNTQNLAKANEEAAKSAEKLANSREKSKLNRQSQEKQQELVQSKAINKNLEDEYKTKQKNEEQARNKASKYIESAQKKLKNAISKYDYGDTSEASAELEKLGKAWANFATKDNPNPTLEQQMVT